MTSKSWAWATCAALLLSLTIATGYARAAVPAWPQALGDIPADPAVTFGVLPNGMRYAIEHNATPPGQVSVRFAILAGSIQEGPGQHGLAHFLEHMAFHGSTHVPDGDVKVTLERMGLRFGPDINAETGPNATVYKFDLAKNDEASIDTALMFSREIASELTLDPKLMDAERGVILNEAHMRAGPIQDLRQAVLADEIGDHSFARLTIGTDEDIKTGSVAALRAFYDAFYRPERAVLIVVGDVDAKVIEAKIKARFSDWAGRGPAGNDPAPVTSAPPGAPPIKIETAPGAPGSGLMLFWNEPYAGPDLTRADLEARTAETLADFATLERVRQATEQAGNPVAIANGPHPADIPLVARSLEWDAATVTDLPGAVGLLVKTDRQVVEYGLTQPELDRVVTQTRSRLEAEVSTADTRPTPALAGQLLGDAISGEVSRSPAQKLATFETVVRGLTLARANKLLRDELTVSEPRVIYFGPTAPAGGEQAIKSALAEANTAQVTAYVDQGVKTWKHTDFGPPGQVVERREMSDVGATFVRFANGVRLVVKPTTFAKDQVLVTVRFGHGQLDLPRDRVAASDYGALLFEAGGLSDLRGREVGEALVGHNVLGRVLMQPDVFEITNFFPGFVTRSEDLDLQLQLSAAVITAPGWRADEWPSWMASAVTGDAAIEASPALLYGRDGVALLHSGDMRWEPSTQSMRAAWTAAQAEAFMKPIVDTSPLEVTIVGDVTVDQAIAATAKSLGALPAREDRPEPPGLRDVRFPAPSGSPVILRHKGDPHEALVVVNWPTTDAYADTRQTRAARVLADVMSARLFDEIRVKHGWTYSPSVVADFSSALPGYGMITARTTCAPGEAAAVLDAIDAVASDLAAHDISADELSRAVGPRLEAFKRAQQNNGYWLNTLAAAQRDPRALVLATRTIGELQGLTPADIRAAAQRWLVKEKSWRAEVLPQSPAA